MWFLVLTWAASEKWGKKEEEYQTAVYKYRAVPLCSVWTLSGELIQRRWYQAGQLYQHQPVKGLRIQKWTQNVKNCKLVVFVPCKSMISGQLYQHHPGKHPNYFGREQKLWYPHIRKPLGHLVRFVFFAWAWNQMGQKGQYFAKNKRAYHQYSCWG